MTVTAFGTANQLVFTTEPVGGVPENTNLSTQPIVKVEDQYGNVVATDNGSVTLGMSSYTASNGGITQGTLACANNTVNAMSGVATFSGCQVTGLAAAGTYVLSASRTGLTPATSSNVIIDAGTASLLGFTTEPSNAFAGITMTPAVTVQVQDSHGNSVSDSGALITLSLSAGSIASGATATTNGSGLATFSSIVIDTPGVGLTMNATTPGASGTSSSFNVTVLVSNSQNTLTDTASDAGSGVKSVAYFYCSGLSGSCTLSTPWHAIGSPATSSPYSVAWTGQPADGNYRVVAVGTDNVLNVSGSSASVPVTIDNAAPSVTVTFPSNGSTYDSSSWTGSHHRDGERPDQWHHGHRRRY